MPSNDELKASLPGRAPSTAARPSDKGEFSEKNYIAALARGLSVMRAFSRQRRELTLAEISKLVDLPRATVRRCLITLHALGYIETTGKYFRLTSQVLTLSQAYFLPARYPMSRNPISSKSANPSVRLAPFRCSSATK